MDNKRLDYIDIAKGLGILAIVWGHIMLFGWSNKLVYSFHIPLFFFLSGMCFNPAKYETVLQLIKRRTKTLLIPYLSFSILTWLIYFISCLLIHIDSIDNCWFYLLQTLLAQGSGGYLEHNVALWFVPCLFMVDLIYYFINKLPEWGNIIVCVFCMLFGITMSSHYNPTSFDFTTLPWSIDTALVAIPFYACGNLMVRHLSHKRVVEWSGAHSSFLSGLVILLTVILLISSMNNGSVSMGHNTLGRNPAHFYFNAFIGCLSTIGFSLLLTFFLKSGFCKKLIVFIRWLGNNSFYVMATHLPLKAILLTIPAHLLHTNTGKGLCSNVWISLIAFVGTITVTAFTVLFINWAKERNHIIKKMV